MLLASTILLTVSLQVPPQEPVALDVAAALERGCALLLEAQEGEGRREWPYEGVYRVPEEPGGEAVIPIGYRVGGTAIACLALVAAPGWDDDAAAGRRAAVARGVAFVCESLAHPLMEPVPVNAYDVRGWGFVYALELLVDLERRERVPEELATEVRDAIPHLVTALEETSLGRTGGWAYAGRGEPSPFMTAPALQALLAAKEAGHDVSRLVLKNALEALERGRAASGSIAYSTPEKPRKRTEEDDLGFMDLLPGATGRMLAVESTLERFGEGDQERLSRAVGAFFAHWDELEKRRQKTGTHVQPYGVAPYYVLYAHLHAARAIEQLSDPAERAARRAELHARLAAIQEPDGGWNDRVFPRSLAYGTATVMLALLAPDAAR